MTDAVTDTLAARAREALSRDQAPRFVGRGWVEDSLGVDVARAAETVRALIAESSLALCGERTFANRLAHPAVHPNEMVAHYGHGTYASLHTVLGEHGVANNPSRTVYAVRARDPGVGATDVRLRSELGSYRLLAMPREVMEAGESEDRLEPGGRYLRATPERALCDWIWFSTPQAGRALTPPPLDMDLEDLDAERLSRLAAAMGISGPVRAWLDRHAEAGADVDASEQVSAALGF